MIKKVAVIMGSDSDWPVVKGACEQLKQFGIPFEAHILSAHRTPAEAADFARNARKNGFGVLICAAGMAAHLAGAFAGNSTLPVIGIPMKGGAMDGLDALLATVQMPSGIPVATVAINGAKNAAVLAAQILAVADDELAAKLDAARVDMAQQIAAKEAKLQAELEAREFVASAGGGAVKATVCGKVIKNLEIKPEVVDPDDIEMLSDLIMAAVNEAMTQCEETTNREMQKLTGGMNLPF